MERILYIMIGLCFPVGCSDEEWGYMKFEANGEEQRFELDRYSTAFLACDMDYTMYVFRDGTNYAYYYEDSDYEEFQISFVVSYEGMLFGWEKGTLGFYGDDVDYYATAASNFVWTEKQKETKHTDFGSIFADDNQITKQIGEFRGYLFGEGPGDETLEIKNGTYEFINGCLSGEDYDAFCGC